MTTRQNRLEAIPRTSTQTKQAAKDTAAAPARALSLEEEMRVRAYEIFEQRGGEPGRELDDWLQAETEVLARHGRSKSAA
jgi:DUF2934 family protein